MKHEAADPSAAMRWGAEKPFDWLLSQAQVIVDVRSPGEFERGAVAEAMNIPLFLEGERSELGLLYRHAGREAAIAQGIAHITPRLARFLATFEPFRGRRLLVYCARGGMRSQATVRALHGRGLAAETLPGGYKAYRQHLAALFAQGLPPQLFVLQGFAGAGKTRLLQLLPNALDLEAAAQHRSSLFGAVGLRPRSQQHFEAALGQALSSLRGDCPVWVEGESRRIGRVILPQGLWQAMCAAPALWLETSLETRAQRIVEEYVWGCPETLPADPALHTLETNPPSPRDAQLHATTLGDPDSQAALSAPAAQDSTQISATRAAALEAALLRTVPQLGRAQVEAMRENLHAGAYRSVVRTLLQRYYDPRYAHSWRDRQFVFHLNGEFLNQAAAQLCAWAQANGSP